MPLASPPPPTGTRTTATSGRSSTTSRPTVPWPAMIRSSSYGGMIGQATLGGDRLGHPLALVAGDPDDDDLRAIGGHPVALDGRRVGRHDDDGRGAEQSRRAGHALGVVARRVGDDAARELGVGQRRDGVVGAADLEGADRLERLRLQVSPRARGPERDERRPDGRRRAGDPRPPGSRRARPARRSRRRHPQRSRSASRWQSMQRAAHGSASSRPLGMVAPQRTQVP